MKAFIIFRDRMDYAGQCLDALFRAGLEVTIVDHGTTFPPAVAWLALLEKAGVPVWYYPGGHPREVYGRPQFREAVGDEPFVVTDPDVVPDAGCPLDWPQHLLALAEAHGQPRVGLGLRTDDLPDHYPRKQQVIEWEAQYAQRLIADGLYDAAVDTTMAVCRGGEGHALNGARTGPPYVAVHLPWHEDPANLPDDVRHYYDHIEPGISFWTIGGRGSAWGNLPPGTAGSEPAQPRLAMPCPAPPSPACRAEPNRARPDLAWPHQTLPRTIREVYPMVTLDSQLRRDLPHERHG